MNDHLRAPFWRVTTDPGDFMAALLDVEQAVIQQAFRRAHALAVVNIECGFPRADIDYGGGLPLPRRYFLRDDNGQPTMRMVNMDPDTKGDVDWLVLHGLARVEQDERVGCDIITLDYTPEDLE